MDLLAPCRSCLQCLPFFHVSPPSSPRLAAAAPSSPYSQEASKATTSDPPQSNEKLPCPSPATAAQDLHLPSKKEKEPQDAKHDKDEPVATFEDAYSTVTECGEIPFSGIVIAPPVSASSGTSLAEDPKDNKITALSELPLQVPFINDITFSVSGLMPLPSPITPAPFGAGYPAGQYPPYDKIYQGQHHGHAHSHQEHENSHHGHEHSFQGHESSHVEHANSHHGHDHSHKGPANSHDGHGPEHSHVHAGPDSEVPIPQPPYDSQVNQELHKDASFHHPHHHDYEVPLLQPPLDDSQVNQELQKDTSSHHPHHYNHDYNVPLPQPPLDDSQVNQELHKDASFHHPHHHNHDSLIVDNADNSVTEHATLDDDHPHYDQIDDASPTPPLETSESTPDLDLEAKVTGENSAVSHTNGASALLETYHSEPVVVLGDTHDDVNEALDEVLGHSGSHTTARRRRRDQFKDQFKGIKQQIKQGGHHVKEEGSKHMKTIIDNMNKQAQQIEQSGSFFIVPRANNN